MVALRAKDRAHVDRIHQCVMANGASDEGAPGQRFEGLYAAYFRDPDGNKLNAFVMG
jgi:predicted lactoylglutathione lyase